MVQVFLKTIHVIFQPSKCVRVKMNVAMVCETMVTPRADGKPSTREDLTCRVQYAAYGMSMSG